MLLFSRHHTRLDGQCPRLSESKTSRLLSLIASSLSAGMFHSLVSGNSGVSTKPLSTTPRPLIMSFETRMDDADGGNDVARGNAGGNHTSMKRVSSQWTFNPAVMPLTCANLGILRLLLPTRSASHQPSRLAFGVVGPKPQS
ncbi:hypothetical protein ARMSODRAFT_688656 [Armillaria solidipes]|uniref:Uncharacterized protein n=1 Tax=Armillaria solidipes TaxID=1076256 RepID=A0A2H3APL2_9AGAR|nr:hypothetical protein ARMSODRAFT_688656 [Armillaria solidipes]